MAQIDPSIALSIKPAQIESPLVHAARAAELQNVQQSQFMNMLKLKEHVDESRTKNELKKWLSGKTAKDLDQENTINELATKFGAQGLALAKQIDDRRKAQGEAAYRAEQIKDLESQRSERAYKLGKTQFTDAISTISSLPNRQAAIDMLYQARVNKTISDDAAENILRMLPNTEDEFPEFKQSLIEKLASADARLQHEDRVNKNKQEQITARRTQFNRVFPPLAITSENDVRARVIAEYNDPILGPELQRYGSLNDLITREVTDFNRNKPAYVGRLAGVSAEKLLESEEQKFKDAYFAHVRQAITNKTKPLSEEAFRASYRQIPSAAVSDQPSAAETLVSNAAAPGVQEVQAFNRNVPRPVIDASAAVAPNAAISAEAARALAPAAAKEQAEYTIHPDAQAYYDLFAISKNQADKAMGDAIQNAHIKQIELQNKPDQLMSVSPGGVVINKATGQVEFTAPAAPEKPEPKTEAQRNYDAAIADGSFKGTFAQYLDQQKETEAEREYRKAKLPVSQGGSGFTGTFLDFKKLIAKANKIVVQTPAAPTLSASALDMNAERFLVDGTLPPGISKANRDAIMNRAAVIAKDKGMSVDRVAQLEVTANKSALAQLSKTETMVGAFEKNFIKNVKIVENLNSKRDSTGVPLLQKWINVGKKAVTGDPDLAALNIAIKAVVNEYGKIVSGSMGNTAVAVSEIKRMEDLLNSAQNPADVVAVLNTMKAETQNRMAGFKEQRAELTGAMRRSTAAPKAKSDVRSRADAILGK